jgi:hypothetical protein
MSAAKLAAATALRPMAATKDFNFNMSTPVQGCKYEVAPEVIRGCCLDFKGLL